MTFVAANVYARSRRPLSAGVGRLSSGQVWGK
jgi:hypothetical protein